MSWSAGLASLRAEFDRKLKWAFANLLIYTNTGQTSAIGDSDAVERSDGTDPGTRNKTQRPVTRQEPWGVRGRPPKGIRALCLRFGSSNVVFIGIAPTEKYGPQDLDVGEVAFYSVSKALIRLWKAGKLTLDSDTGAGQDVVVNGGTLSVARKTDKVAADTSMATWIANVTKTVAAIDKTTTAPTDFGVISGGADHLKA